MSDILKTTVDPIAYDEEEHPDGYDYNTHKPPYMHFFSTSNAYVPTSDEFNYYEFYSDAYKFLTDEPEELYGPNDILTVEKFAKVINIFAELYTDYISNAPTQKISEFALNSDVYINGIGDYEGDGYFENKNTIQDVINNLI